MNKEELLEIEKIVNEGKAEMCWISPNRKQVKELIKMALELVAIKGGGFTFNTEYKSLSVTDTIGFQTGYFQKSPPEFEEIFKKNFMKLLPD